MFASRSAMLSESSLKEGSREERGWSPGLTLVEAEGVDCEARREERDGGRRGVVGREGIAPEWVRECEAEVWRG